MSRSPLLTRRSLLAATTLSLVPRRALAFAGSGGEAARFGILPDLPGDQTAAIQSALEETRATGTPFFLPPGRYQVSGLELRSGAKLAGIYGATRLVARGDRPLVTAAGATDAALTGLVLEGTASEIGGDAALVDLKDVERLDIEACALDGSPGNGIVLHRCGGRVVDTRIAGAGRGGLFSTDGRGLEIASNEVADCGDNGIQVWTSDKRECGTRVTGNRVTRVHARSGGSGQYGNGISVFRAGGVTVTGNRVTDCVYSAIRANSGSNVVVSDNNVARLGEVALFVEFAFDGAIVSGNLIDGADGGIVVTNFDHGGRLAVISGNLVRNIGNRAARHGTGIFAAADTAVTGNVVENAGFSALTLGYGPYLRDVTVTGNVLRQARHGIVVSVVEGAGSAVVSDNVLGEIEAEPIVGMEWEKIVAENLAEEAPRRFPHLEIARNRVT